MKILKNKRRVVSNTQVEYQKEIYLRLEYEDGLVEWEGNSFDGELDDEDLEKEYQKLIKSNQLNSWKKIFKEGLKHRRGDEMYWVDDVFEWLEKTFEVPKLKK